MEKFFSWMLDGSEAWAKIFTIVLFIVAIFFIFREVITWYYKVNRIVELLESIDRKLGMIAQADPSNDTSDSSINRDISAVQELSAVKVEEKIDKNIDLKEDFNTESTKEDETVFARRKGKMLAREYNFEDIFSTKKGKHDKK